jgi:hypothetical protein
LPALSTDRDARAPRIPSALITVKIAAEQKRAAKQQSRKNAISCAHLRRVIAPIKSQWSDIIIIIIRPRLLLLHTELCVFAKCIHFLGSTVIKYGNLFSLSASESAAGYKKIYYASETFTHLSGKHHAE